MEHLEYIPVVALSRRAALEMFGLPETTKVENVGPAEPDRYTPGAREYRVYRGETDRSVVRGLEIVERLRKRYREELRSAERARFEAAVRALDMRVENMNDASFANLCVALDVGDTLDDVQDRLLKRLLEETWP